MTAKWFGLGLVVFALTLATPVDGGANADTPSATQAAKTEIFVIIYRPGPAWRPDEPFSKQGLGPHGAYMQRLLDSGHIFLAGGFADQDGGMVILRAENMEEAQRLLKADPAVVSGIFVGEIEGWAPRFRSDDPLPRAN